MKTLVGILVSICVGVPIFRYVYLQLDLIGVFLFTFIFMMALMFTSLWISEVPKLSSELKKLKEDL